MPIIESNILDFALAQTGTIESLFDVALLNGVGITESVAAGTPMNVPGQKYEVRPINNQVAEPEYESHEIKERQTVVDFAVQHTGTMEALFELALLNGISITQAIAPGTLLNAKPIELKPVTFYQNSVLDIITDETVSPVPGGIGYMQIGNTFKVS